MEPLEITFHVDCSPAHAFDVWTRRTSMWWPRSHTVSGDPSTDVSFEPREGGRIFERTADGTEHDWGEILEWDPPDRLVYLWHLMFEREDATTVEITFRAAEGGTAVAIVHRGWEHLGDVAQERRNRNRRGWDGLLPHFTGACETV